MSSIFDFIPAIKTPIQILFPANGSSTSGGFVSTTMETIQFSCTNGAGINDYYLVTLTGQAALSVRGTIFVDSYDFDITPHNPSAIILGYPSPATSPGNVTVTVGSSTTITGTVGFEGDAGTGSMSVSGTQSSSTSYSVPDVVIENVSQNGPGNNNAAWSFKVAEQSAVQNSDLSYTLQTLFMIDRSKDQAAGNFGIDITYTIHVSDHDGSDGTRWFDTFHAELTPALPTGSSFDYDNDRIGHITLPVWTVAIATPPLAKLLEPALAD